MLPDGPVTKIYNVITAVAVMYVGFSIFLTIGFSQYLPPYNVYLFEKVMDGWFWVDMVLNFATAFYNNGKLVTHPGEIVLHYIQTWFLVDFLGNLPLEQMTNFGHRGERKMLKILKFLKIPRLLRLARLRRILQGKGKYVSLFMYIALTLLVIHAAGSLWMLALGPCSEFPPHCDSEGTLCDWHFLEDIDPNIILQEPSLGPECLPSTLGSLYAMALSYGASMVLGAGGIEIDTLDGGHYRTRELSIGSLDNVVVNETAPTTLTPYDLIHVSAFPPNSFGASFFTTIWALSVVARILGFLGVAFLTAVILKLEINAGYRETVFRRHVEAIEAELSAAGAAIPDPLMKRIKEHIAERWHSGDFGRSELQTTGLFSAQLKGEVIAALNKDVLMKIPFFRVATYEAIQLICQSIQDRKFLPGELIFRRGEVANGMYLIRSGTVLLSPFSTSWTNVRRTVAAGDRRVLKELADDGSRPMRTSFTRFRRKARSFRRSLTNSFRRRPADGRNDDDWTEEYLMTSFPVTTGSWFGESEILRELVIQQANDVYRRSTTAEAKTVVSLLFIPTDALGTVLFDFPPILQELLTAHLKRFSSADLPPALRAAFRHSDEWEERVNALIGEISRAKHENKNEEDIKPQVTQASRSLIRSADDANICFSKP